VPTANSQPRDITNGPDGNRWFTEGTEFTNAPAKIARITPRGDVTEFAPDLAAGCNFCILTDIAQGPGNILWIVQNDPALTRFNVVTETFETPVAMPNSNALGGSLAVHGDDVWITDFNNDVVWHYRNSTGQFTSVPASDPSDVAVDAAGNAWFTEPHISNIGRIDAVTGVVTRTPTMAGAGPVFPTAITVAADGQVWFSARFDPPAIGRLNPADNSVTVFLLPSPNVGPAGIAASPDGTIWFTQESVGNIASITNSGVITQGKIVKGSGPAGITVADNGDPWYTMRPVDKIATLQLS
jgi:streptogramin lyase